MPAPQEWRSFPTIQGEAVGRSGADRIPFRKAAGRTKEGVLVQRKLASQGFAGSNFTIHCEEQYAVCPEGKQSTKWNEVQDRSGNPVIKIGFASRNCRVCPSRERCTRSVRPRRTITLRPEKQNAALQAARQRESTKEFGQEYGKRAGVEGTLSQAVRVCEMRRSRYAGLTKTHLQHVFTATALNFLRVGQWLLGTPRARTRESAFVRLMTSPT